MNTWLLVTIYYILTLFFTVLIAGVQQQTGFVTPETVILPQLAPGIAAALMLLFFKKYHFKKYHFKKARFTLTFSVAGVPFTTYALVLLVPSVLLRWCFFSEKKGCSINE